MWCLKAISRLAAAAAWLCSCAEPAVDAVAEPWPEANQLFASDPLWLGGDGAYSCDLGSDGQGRGRVLWLFGDSLIAQDARRDRDHAWFVRNSVAIQTGYDPSQAYMQFFWGQRDGHASSYFADPPQRWFWPGPCAKIGSKLFVFGGWLYQQSAGTWGFAGDRGTVFAIDNPDSPPDAWQPRELPLPAEASQVQLGTAAFVQDGWWIHYGGVGRFHDYAMARFALADVEAEDFTRPQVFAGGRWQPWTPNGPGQDTVVAMGAPESSVHFAAQLGQYVMAQSEGFGATTLAVRTAPQPQGPWSAPQTVLRPPESFIEGSFVYAGKGHPELQGGDLVLTYVPSQFDDVPRIGRDDWYLPHFARVRWQGRK